MFSLNDRNLKNEYKYLDPQLPFSVNRVHFNITERTVLKAEMHPDLGTVNWGTQVCSHFYMHPVEGVSLHPTTVGLGSRGGDQRKQVPELRNGEEVNS